MPKGRKSKNITHCIDCNVELDVLNSVFKLHYRQSRCKECFNKRYYGRYEEYRAEFRNRPEAKLQKRNLQLQRDFGLSLDDYNKLLELHLGGCAVCKQKPVDRNLDVDHNHKTGEVRGLLCKKCNTVIGLLGESEDYIWNIMEYLKRTTWSKEDVA